VNTSNFQFVNIYCEYENCLNRKKEERIERKEKWGKRNACFMDSECISPRKRATSHPDRWIETRSQIVPLSLSLSFSLFHWM